MMMREKIRLAEKAAEEGDEEQVEELEKDARKTFKGMHQQEELPAKIAEDFKKLKKRARERKKLLLYC
jgi:hypothetical protein